MKRFDVVAIGSGPAGQAAARTAVRAGKTAAIVERSREIGGACLHRGTIPSKTLREASRRILSLQRDGEAMGLVLPPRLPTELLARRLREVISGHCRQLAQGFESEGIERIYGSASLAGPNLISVEIPGDAPETIEAKTIVIATGSKPRDVPNLEADHDQVLDSDSILSLDVLPESMLILGGGVIACEYASIFASLGVTITMLDRSDRPLGFLDPDLSAAFVDSLHRSGGRYRGGVAIESLEADGFTRVDVRLGDGRVFSAERVMVALGRTPCSSGLGLEDVGVATDARGRIQVDEHCQTNVPGVYAVGDVIGAPGLASTSFEQGRRAVRHALELAPGKTWRVVPIGIYTVPELGAVGLTEPQAREACSDVVVARAEFADLARSHIDGNPEGYLKLIANRVTGEILGVAIAGEGAAELVAVGQTAMLLGGCVRDLVENIFNFPTLAEAYRVAALQILQGDEASRRAA